MVILVLAVLLGLLGRGTGHGADWSMVSSLALRAEYSSNLFYEFQRPKAGYRITLTPSTVYSYNSDKLQLQARFGTMALSYSTQGENYRFNHNYFLSGQYGLTPRLNFQMTTAYTLDSTSQEEIAASGNTTGQITRQSINLSPGFSYALTERLTSSLGVSFSQVHYSAKSPDFITQQVNAGFSYKLSEITSMNLNLMGSQIRYQEISDQTSSMSASLGLSRQFAADWSLKVSGGLTYTFSSTSTRVLDLSSFPFFILVRQQQKNSSNFSPNANITIIRQWEKISIQGSFVRNQSGSSLGTVMEVNGLNLGLNYPLTERLSGSSGIGFYRNEGVSGQSSLQSTLFNLNTSLSYSLTERISLKSGLTFLRREDEITIRRITNSHGGWLQLGYSYPVKYQW